MRGVPLRLEIGPKDIEKGQVVLVRRDTREKGMVPMDGLTAHVGVQLETIQRALHDRALKFREEHTIPESTYEGFKKIMDGRPGFVVSPWCGDAECEAQIKAETQATLRNIPLDAVRWSAAGPPGPPCIKCGRPAVAEAWFAKAY
jgi:prolyl-tRNA synthetase